MAVTPRQARTPPRREPHRIHDPAYLRFRETLREWRTEANLSQRALAERMGKSVAWINRSETGGRRVDALEWLEWLKACKVGVLKAVKRLDSP